jgi:hypothetical protein
MFFARRTDDDGKLGFEINLLAADGQQDRIF